MLKLISAFYFVLFVCVIGWIANIVKIVNVGFEVAQWGGLEVLRVVGIFVAPLGSILGLFF